MTAAPLKESEVLAFLRERPDFLLRYPDLLDTLKLPKRDGNTNVAAFGSYLVEKLKTEKAAAQATAQELVEISRLNMNTVERIHKAVVRVLEAKNFLQFIQFLTTDCASLLDVDVIAIAVESAEAMAPQLVSAGVHVVPKGTIDHWMDGRTHLLQSDIRGAEQIYGPAGCRLVRSQAVLRLELGGKDSPDALIAFGSRDPDAFDDTAGLELVGFLVRVIERCLRGWLEL